MPSSKQFNRSSGGFRGLRPLAACVAAAALTGLAPLRAFSAPQAFIPMVAAKTGAPPGDAGVPQVAAAEKAAIGRMFGIPGASADKPANDDVRQMTSWIVSAGDSRGLPFMIIDKVGARLYVFTPEGRLRGSSPVLLGLARGDDSVPGIGTRKIADIQPEERTTPAGRFVAEKGRNSHGEDIVWVDYDNAISMHRVRATNPAERRLQRLATPTSGDNRISYGCINVPVKFYNAVVNPTFERANAVVYVLPETRPLQAVFVNMRRDTRQADAAATPARTPAQRGKRT